MKFMYTIYLIGEGETPEDGWQEAVNSFTGDPGWYDEYRDLDEDEYLEEDYAN